MSDSAIINISSRETEHDSGFTNYQVLCDFVGLSN